MSSSRPSGTVPSQPHTEAEAPSGTPNRQLSLAPIVTQSRSALPSRRRPPQLQPGHPHRSDPFPGEAPVVRPSSLRLFPLPPLSRDQGTKCNPIALHHLTPAPATRIRQPLRPFARRRALARHPRCHTRDQTDARTTPLPLDLTGAPPRYDNAKHIPQPRPALPPDLNMPRR